MHKYFIALIIGFKLFSFQALSAVHLKITNNLNNRIEVFYRYFKALPDFDDTPQSAIIEPRKHIVLSNPEKLQTLKVNAGTTLSALAAAAVGLNTASGMPDYELIENEVWPAMTRFPEQNIELQINPSYFRPYYPQVEKEPERASEHIFLGTIGKLFPDVLNEFTTAELEKREPIILPHFVLNLPGSASLRAITDAYKRDSKRFEIKRREATSAKEAQQYTDALNLVNAAHDALVKRKPTDLHHFNQLVKQLFF